MTLFVSDLHLGRGSAALTRAAERDAVALLRAYEPRLVGGAGTLVLLGDVFDQYIEYRHLVPKGAARLMGTLADLADRGARILYAVGNRDPWHIDYFARDLGVETLRDGLSVGLDGHAVYIHHGDGMRPSEQIPRSLRSFLRAPAIARLYRMMLPGDTGYALARWTALRLGTDGTPDREAAAELLDVARTRLAATDADIVAFGHVHAAALVEVPGGTYVNPGYWFGQRTFVTLDETGPALMRWTAAGCPEPLAAPPTASA
jgi:UDP-2,3-diacylglucosamine hydrolase